MGMFGEGDLGRAADDFRRLERQQASRPLREQLGLPPPIPPLSIDWSRYAQAGEPVRERVLACVANKKWKDLADIARRHLTVGTIPITYSTLFSRSTKNFENAIWRSELQSFLERNGLGADTARDAIEQIVKAGLLETAETDIPREGRSDSVMRFRS